MFCSLLASLRTALFYLLMVPWTIACSLFAMVALYLLPYRHRHAICVRIWAQVSVFLCRVICGVRWQVEGEEHIPSQPCVLASNHQSAWETIFFQTRFSPQSTVVKRELLFIPFFGWALKRLSSISIDRGDQRIALQQLICQGTEHVRKGAWVLIFPEGTRQKWPNLGKIRRGAATLAKKSKAPLLPVVHTAGYCWAADRWTIKPGLVVVRFGPALLSTQKTTYEINTELESWLKANLSDLVKSDLRQDKETAERTVQNRCL